jgi:hypothetical protein
MSAKQGEITSFFQNKKANDDGDEISTSTDLLSNNLNEAQDQTALCAEISSLELSMTSTSALLTYLNLTPKTYSTYYYKQTKKNAFQCALEVTWTENVSLP